MKDRIQRYGGEVITLVILVPLVLVLAVILNRYGSVSPTKTPPSPVPSLSATSTPTPTEIAKQQITISIISPTSNTIYHFQTAQNQTTVANVLLHTSGLHVQTKDYGGSLGLFIEAINGVANDPSKQLYWDLYINGQRSVLGASSAAVKPGDTIKWVLEKAPE